MLAIAVVLVMGVIIVDYSMLLADRSHLQYAVDAAALAAATELKKQDDTSDTQRAQQIAVDVARENGITVNTGDVVFSDDYKQVTVSATRTRDTFFAKIWGISYKTVSTKASAFVAAGTTLTTAQSNPRAVPIAITWETYRAYRNYGDMLHSFRLIRQNAETFGQDEFVLFDLRDSNAKSPAFMERQLTGQDSETVKYGVPETTLDDAINSQQNKLESGLTTLFSSAAAAPWYDGNPTDLLASPGTHYNQIVAGTEADNNPRLVYLIITTSTSSPTNGTYNAPAQGFARVYLESYQKVGTESYLQVRFLPATTSSDGAYGGSDADAEVSALRVISLSG